MNTIKLNLELAKTMGFEGGVAASLTAKQEAVSEPKPIEMPPRPPIPAWVWGFSSMLPWGTLKEGL